MDVDGSAERRGPACGCGCCSRVDEDGGRADMAT